MTNKLKTLNQKLIRKAKRIIGNGPKKVDAPIVDRRLIEVCQRVREKRLTYLPLTALQSLVHLVEELERNSVTGKIVEAGCALGGSSITICAAKNSDRPLEIYDTFEMIPPPSEKDGKDVIERYELIKKGKARGIEGDEYYGYLHDIPARVTASFAEFDHEVSENNVSLHKGLLQDTMHIDSPVALAHIDVDWYEPVYTSLQRVLPFLDRNGVIVLDDYFSWSGCRDATDDFFRDCKGEFEFCGKYGHMIVRYRN